MQSLLHALTGLWGAIQRLPFTTQLASGTLIVLVAVLGFLNLPSQNQPENSSVAAAQTVNLETQTVGAESEAFATFASWPGEIISPHDTDVQPPREGTIVSWNVTIGQQVQAGAVLGHISAAPLTPELASTLAERAAGLAQARSNLSSTQSYVDRSKTQLNTFATTDTAQRAIDDATQTASVAAESVRNSLRQAVIKEFNVFSGNNGNVLGSRDGLALRPILWNFGATNSSLRDKYVIASMNALDALEETEMPQQEGSVYFQAATQLVSASISGTNFTESELNRFRDDIAADQKEFTDAVEKYREALLAISEKKKEQAERTRETATKATELDREQATAAGDLAAAEAAYSATAGAINGGTAIIAPKSGYVSAIIGQTGTFVAPGTTVASISSGVNTGKLVRFRIPSNVEVPKKGDKVKIIRPGFAKDVRTATITGVGTALDGNGAFMADAQVDGELEWPAHLSVRVVPEKSTNQTIAVPFDAVFWNEQNKPRVWLVKEGGIITSQEVKTGRTFGDAVEILEGLALGDTYLMQASENITEGMRIEEAAVTEEPAAAPAGDGHGHVHE